MHSETGKPKPALEGGSPRWLKTTAFLAVAGLTPLFITAGAGPATDAAGIFRTLGAGIGPLGPWWRGAVVLATGGSVSLGTYLLARRRNRADKILRRDVHADRRIMDACRREISAIAQKDDERVLQVLREWFR